MADVGERPRGPGAKTEARRARKPGPQFNISRS